MLRLESTCEFMRLEGRRKRSAALTSNLRLGKEALDGEELVAADVDLVTLIEAARDHALLHLDGEVHLVDRPEDLVDLADDGLVREVDRRVEVRHFVCHERLAEHLVLDCVQEGAHF